MGVFAMVGVSRSGLSLVCDETPHTFCQGVLRSLFPSLPCRLSWCTIISGICRSCIKVLFAMACLILCWCFAICCSV